MSDDDRDIDVDSDEGDDSDSRQQMPRQNSSVFFSQIPEIPTTSSNPESLSFTVVMESENVPSSSQKILYPPLNPRKQLSRYGLRKSPCVEAVKPSLQITTLYQNVLDIENARVRGSTSDPGTYSREDESLSYVTTRNSFSDSALIAQPTSSQVSADRLRNPQNTSDNSYSSFKNPANELSSKGNLFCLLKSVPRNVGFDYSSESSSSESNEDFNVSEMLQSDMLAALDGALDRKIIVVEENKSNGAQ